MKPTARLQSPATSTPRGTSSGLAAAVDKWIHWDFTQVDQDAYNIMKDATIPDGQFSSSLPTPDKVTGVVADATAAYMRQNQINHTVKSRTLQWSALGETVTFEDKWIKVPQMSQQVFDRVLQAVEPKVKQAIKDQTEIGTIPSDQTIIGLQNPLQDVADFFWEWWLVGINKSNRKLPAKADSFDRGIQRYLMIEVDNWGASSGGGGSNGGSGGQGSESMVRVRIQAASRSAVQGLKTQFIRSAGGDIVRSEGPLTIIADVPADSIRDFKSFGGVQSITPLSQGNGGGDGDSTGGGQQAGIIPGVSNSTLVIGAASLASITIVAASA